MGFEELLKVAKTTNERIDGSVRKQIEQITRGKEDPQFHIAQFLYEVLVTMWVEKSLIEQIELGIEKVKAEMTKEAAADE